MNDEDRLNLHFLTHSSEDVLQDWYSKVDEDDHKYASALLTCASWEIMDLLDDIDVSSDYLSKFSIDKIPPSTGMHQEG